MVPQYPAGQALASCLCFFITGILLSHAAEVGISRCTPAHCEGNHDFEAHAVMPDNVDNGRDRYYVTKDNCTTGLQFY